MRAAFAIAAFALCMNVHANDGWYLATGAAGAFGKNHPHIQMLKEHIRVDLRERDAKVDVLFTFKNHGPATSVMMAFPEEYTGPATEPLHKFKSWVDGKPVKVRRKIVEFNENDSDQDDQQAVWLKKVWFAKNATRRVRVSYNAGYAGNTSGDRFLVYFLKTGASWKAPISECRITADWTSVRSLSKPVLTVMGAQPTWKVTGRRRRETVLRNFRPTGNLNLAMLAGFWNFTINGKPVPQEGRGYYGKPIEGRGSDPLIHVRNIERFFGGWGKDRNGERSWNHWQNPVVKKFGGPLEWTGKALKLANGKIVKLRRPSRQLKALYTNKVLTYVYLKDVVEAVGGRFRYDRRLEQVQLTF